MGNTHLHTDVSEKDIAVVVDLMNTTLRGKKGHWDAQAQVYRDVLRAERSSRLPGTANPVIRTRDVQRIGREKRGYFARHRIPPERAWIYINIEIMTALDPELLAVVSPDAQAILGAEIHRRIQSLTDIWKLDRSIQSMLTGLSELGVPLYIGSNQEGPYVRRLHEEFDLARWFPLERCFDSNSIGVYKPNTDFIDEIARRIGKSPEDIIYIGDSPTSDAAMVESGCRVILLDHDGHSKAETSSPLFRNTYRRELASRQLILLGSPRKVLETIRAELLRNR